MSWTPLYGQSPQSSPPLTEGEKRQILGQLFELRSCRAELAAYQDFVKRETEQDAKERDLATRALELEKQATSLAQKERDLALEKAAFYEQAYRTVTKKPGFWCHMKRFFTLGIARCR